MLGTGPLGGQTRLLGVIGFPVGHSLSPVMHNEAFQSQKMNCYYGAFAVAPEAIGEALAGIRSLGIVGVNVTIPLKESVMPFLDEVAPVAQQVGAVNTIVNRGGRLVGHNTDGWGFMSSLDEAGVKPNGLHAVILGAGGAAKAIALHLAMAEVASVTVSNRTMERAEALSRHVGSLMPEVSMAAVELGSPQERLALEAADLVVNCTPLGMEPANIDLTPVLDIERLRDSAVVYDTVYKPGQTRLLREAGARGLQAISGLGMLVHQGACAWEYWFGRRGPVTVMYEAVRVALEGGR